MKRLDQYIAVFFRNVKRRRELRKFFAGEYKEIFDFYNEREKDYISNRNRSRICTPYRLTHAKYGDRGLAVARAISEAKHLDHDIKYARMVVRLIQLIKHNRLTMEEKIGIATYISETELPEGFNVTDRTIGITLINTKVYAELVTRILFNLYGDN